MREKFKLKKKVLLTSIILIMLVCGSFIYVGLSKNREIDINKVLESSSYSYLPVEAKNFIIEAYEKTGNIVLTEKNKKDGVAYLNPEFVDYLTLSDTEKSSSSLIPETYIFDYVSTNDTTDSLPAKYNLADVDGKSFVSKIKSQGKLGICWAFASYGQVESNLLISANKSYDSSSQLFSERQMDYATSKNGIKNYNNKMGFRSLGAGGNFTISSYAMSTGLTMVDESLMEYSESLDQLEYSQVLNDKNSLYEVDRAVNMPVLNIAGLDLTNDEHIKIKDSYLSFIKNSVIKYGGMYVGTQSPQSSCSVLDNNSALIRVDNYCVENSGHAMQIVGWDDDYEYKYCYNSNSNSHSAYTSSCSSDNTIVGKGAWILKNSWEDRYPYVYLAYDSLNSRMGVVTEISSASDKNWNNYYSMNFLKKAYSYISSSIQSNYKRVNASSEKIMKVKFIATSYNTSYDVYVNDDKIKSVEIDNPGLYTVDFSDDDAVLEEQDFSVKISGSSSGLVVDGIQVFTKTIDSKQEISTKDTYFRSKLSTKSSDNYEFIVSTDTVNIDSGEILTYKLYDSNRNDISSKVSVTNNVVSANLVNAFFSIDGSVPAGVYTLHTLYKTLDVESKVTLYPINEIAGEGVESSPYIITSIVELETLGDKPDAYFKLGNDIKPIDGFSWTPVDFYGNLDGAGHTIYGLNDSLFKLISANSHNDVVIKDLVIKDFTTSKGGALSNKVIDFIDYDGSKSEYNVLIENVAILGDDINITSGSLIGNISLMGNKLSINSIFSSIINHSDSPALIDTISGVSGSSLSVNNVEILGKFNIAKKTYKQGLLANGVNTGLSLSNFIITAKNTNPDYSDYNSVIGDVKSSIVDDVSINFGYYVYADSAVSKYEDGKYFIIDGDITAGVSKKDIADLVSSELYSNWFLFNKYWKLSDISGVSRIPILSFVDFEYTNISDILLNEGDSYNIFNAMSSDSLLMRDIEFKINDSSIASIDAKGNILALKVGKTTISVTSNYDGFNGDIGLTVVGDKNYTIKYDSNNNTGDVINETVPIGKKITLKSNTFSKLGYKFDGWNTELDGSGQFYSDQAEVESLTSVEGDTVVLYAQWSPIKYTVIFDGNEQSSGEMSDIVGAKYDEEFTLTLNSFKKIGYKFVGWNTMADGSGDSYKDGATVKNLTADSQVILFAQWETINYTVKFNGNGGSGNMADQVLVYNETNGLTANTYVRRGYKFIGWNTMADGSGDSYDDVSMIKNLSVVDGDVITLYAQWETINYTVKFNGNGGSGDMADQKFNYENISKLSKNLFEKKGYNFASWTTYEDGSGASYADGIDLSEIEYGDDSIITLYAQWTPIQYTIKYHPNGGSGEMSDAIFQYDVSYTLETNSFTRYGYNFIGWNTKIDGDGTSYLDSSEVSNLTDKDGDFVLYAQWEAIEYEIQFDANGGEGKMPGQSLVYDVPQHLNPNKFTRPGYTFGGWNTRLDGTGTSYEDEAEVLNILILSDDDIILYAQWRFIGYEVKFDANGGAGDMTSQLFDFDITEPLDENAYTKLGYKFIGWNTKADGSGTSYANMEKITNLTNKQETVVLYAQWLPIKYEIRFVGNDAVGEMPNQIFKYDEKANLVPNSYTREGYKFIGWNTVLNGTGTGYVDGDSIYNLVSDEDEIIVLYAQWKKIEYEIQFDANGGSGSMSSQTLGYGDIEKLNGNTYSRTGYKFVGWNSKADGTGTSYNDKEEIQNLTNKEETIILYAIWSPISYTVKFNGNGGDGKLSDITLQYDESKQIPTDVFTKKGYIIDSWNLAVDGTGTSYLAINPLVNLSSIDGDVITLYAQYKPINYTIAFMPNGGNGTMDSQKFVYDVETKLNENTFVRNGYYFKEWNSKADGTGKSYKDQEAIINLTDSEENIILYAIWKLDIDYEIKNYVLDDDNYLRKIKPNTKLKDYLTNFEIGQNYSIAVYGLDNNLLKDDDLIFTGSITEIVGSNGDTLEIKNIILGDVNGDGKVTAADVSKVYRYIKKRITIDEKHYLLAGNVNGDDKVTTADVSKIYRYIKKKVDSLD